MGWFPIAAVLVSSCALILWHYSIVDFPWLVDQLLATISSAEEREQTAEFLSKNMMIVSSLASALVSYSAIVVILGGYLMIASKVLAHGISFGKGLALAAWSSIPHLLLFPLGAIQVLLASSGRIGVSALNPISLNQLFFRFDMAHPLAILMDSVSLTTIWGIFLLVIGFEVWANVKRSTAILVVVVPHLVVYGPWFIYGMSKIE